MSNVQINEQITGKKEEKTKELQKDDHENPPNITAIPDVFHIGSCLRTRSDSHHVALAPHTVSAGRAYPVLPLLQ